MHQAELGGPVYWFLLVILFGSGLLSFYVIFDSFRSARAERLSGGWTRALWVGPQVVYAAAFVASVIPDVPAQVRLITAAIAPIAVILQTSYLLKIAYPKPEEGDIPPGGPESGEGDPAT